MIPEWRSRSTLNFISLHSLACAAQKKLPGPTGRGERPTGSDRSHLPNLHPNYLTGQKQSEPFPFWPNGIQISEQLPSFAAKWLKCQGFAQLMVVWQLWGPSVCQEWYFLNLLPPPVVVCVLTKGRTLLATICSNWCLCPPHCLKATLEFSLVTNVPICCLKAALIFCVFLFHLLGLQRPWRNGIAG